MTESEIASPAGEDVTFAYLSSPVEFFRARRPVPAVLPTTLFGGPCFLLTGPEAHEFVHVSGRAHFSHAIGYHRINAIFGGPHLPEKRVMLALDGEPWEAQHELVLPLFAPAYVKQAVEVKRAVYEQGIAAWDGTVDVCEALQLLVLRSALRSLYGLDIDESAAEFRDLIQAMATVALATFGDPTTHTQAAEHFRRLTALCAPQFAAKRGCPVGDGASRYVTDRTIAGRPLADEEVMSCLAGQFFAAHGTTKSMMVSVLYLLLRHPERAALVRSEIAGIVGDEAPSYAHIGNPARMPILDNVLKEAERMYPPLHLYSRGVVEGFRLGGFEVPKGAIVHLVPVGAHYDPAIFADPDRFDPDRFAPPRSEDRRTPYALDGFGAGERICVGRQLARVDVKLFTILCLQHFELEPAFDGELEYAWAPEPGPRNGLPVTLRRKEAR